MCALPIHSCLRIAHLPPLLPDPLDFLSASESALPSTVYFYSQAASVSVMAYPRIMMNELCWQVNILCITIDEVILYGDVRAIRLLPQLALSPALATFAFGAVLVYFRRRTLAAARRLIRADQARYDALWRDVAAADGAEKRLAELRDLALSLGGRSRQPPRQFHRLPEGGPDPNRPIRSLDQLYVQVKIERAYESNEAMEIQSWRIH